ncbi:hypothetical protein ACTWQB_00510 [Piscibacillus sp. B03]|uniref:hypothetical protein n=1 Tax=Piscibacillus sp. B03 TaxID=3457430 RepID=UPI003FCE6F8F
MKSLEDFKELEWIDEEVATQDSEDLKVKHVVPNRFSHYCKVLNPIFRDEKISDESLLYRDCDPDSVELTFGEKLSYKDLANKYGLSLSKEFSSSTIAEALGGYPRYMILGGEGTIEEDAFQEVLSVLKLFTPQEQCYFHYSFLKIIGVIHNFDNHEHGLLYEGSLDDVRAAYDKGDHVGLGSPTYWWAKDQSWCIHTDYDSDFSIVCGSKELVEALLSNPEIECIQVDLDTKIGRSF